MNFIFFLFTIDSMKTSELTEEKRHENRLDISSVDLSPNTQVSSVQVSNCSLKFSSLF